MRIEISSFSEQGRRLGEILRERLLAAGDDVGLARCGGNGPTLSEWTEKHFDRADALVFVGATGIATRAVARELQSKASDPAVLVVDETGRFVVSLLSGHLGGANDLSRRVADLLGATPVITTATDANELFGVDTWARRKRYAVLEPERIKPASAKILAGTTLRLKTALPIDGALPKYVALAEEEHDFYVGFRRDDDSRALHIVPPVLSVGIGCRKGTTGPAIAAAFADLCRQADVYPEAIAAAYSIDLKKDEAGIVEFCAEREIPFRTFSVAELNAVKGEFSRSRFVEETTGVDSVAERSAVLGSGGRLFWPKTVADGVAVALAVVNAVLDFGRPDEWEGQCP